MLHVQIFVIQRSVSGNSPSISSHLPMYFSQPKYGMHFKEEELQQWWLSYFNSLFLISFNNKLTFFTFNCKQVFMINYIFLFHNSFFLCLYNFPYSTKIRIRQIQSINCFPIARWILRAPKHACISFFLRRFQRICCSSWGGNYGVAS